MKAKNNYMGFIFALVFITVGIAMISKNLVAVGVNSRTQSLSGFGGHLLILIGCIFLFVGYYGLSPYSKIRRFFEGSPIKRTGSRKEKDSSKR